MLGDVPSCSNNKRAVISKEHFFAPPRDSLEQPHRQAGSQADSRGSAMMDNLTLDICRRAPLILRNMGPGCLVRVRPLAVGGVVFGGKATRNQASPPK